VRERPRALASGQDAERQFGGGAGELGAAQSAVKQAE
jgi:hypothetical protein